MSLIVGSLLLASAWISSVVYGWTVNSIIYSPWLGWGLVLLGLVAIAVAFVLERV
jgi:hypothetical protein